MRRFLGNLETLSFNALIGFWAVYGGAVGLLKYGATADALDRLLGGLLVDAFQICYLVAGLAVLLGLGRGRRNVEAFGLVIVLVSVLVRQIALVYVLGASPLVVNSLVFNGALVIVCLARLRALSRGVVLVVFDAGKA